MIRVKKNQPSRRVLSTWLCVLGLYAVFPSAHTASESLAVHSSQPDQIYTSGPQPNRVLATQEALQRCSRKDHKINGYCEIISVDGTAISSPAQLLPKSKPHPLFLWHYASDKGSIFLAGTVHMLRPGFYPLPEPYTNAFKIADHLAVEVHMDRLPSSAVANKLIAYARLPAGQTLKGTLPADTYTHLEEATASFGINLNRLQAFKPAFVYQQLSLLAFQVQGYDPDLGVERYFLSKNQNPVRPVIELETMDEQFDMLFNQPLAMQTAVLEETLTQLDAYEKSSSDLLRAFLAGDERAMAALIDEQAGEHPLSRAFTEALLDQRNQRMAEKIYLLSTQPGNYLVLVGSAHLVGDQSIVRLLERKGLQGRRVASNDNLLQTRQGGR